MGGDHAGDRTGKHEQSKRVRIGVDRAADGNVRDRERVGPRSNIEDTDGVVADEDSRKREEGDSGRDQADRPVHRILGDVSRDDEEVESEDDAGEDGKQSATGVGSVPAGVEQKDPEEGCERY